MNHFSKLQTNSQLLENMSWWSVMDDKFLFDVFLFGSLSHISPVSAEHESVSDNRRSAWHELYIIIIFLFRCYWSTNVKPVRIWPQCIWWTPLANSFPTHSCYDTRRTCCWSERCTMLQITYSCTWTKLRAKL